MNQTQSVADAKRRKVKRRGRGLLLNKRELADVLGEEERTIITWVRAGILPVISCGYRTQRFKLSDCIGALEKRTIQGNGRMT
jgi:hypothetical protein